MRIVVSSIYADDQDKALGFHTARLEFVMKTGIPPGAHRWLTVVSPKDPNGGELVLEPDRFPAVAPFKKALVDDGLPMTSFGVEDVRAEYKRLLAAGVNFTQSPVAMGPVTTAVLDNTCGNLNQLAQQE